MMQHDYIGSQSWVARAMMERNKALFIDQWLEEFEKASNMHEKLLSCPDPSSIIMLPSPSLFVQLPFRLASPFISNEEKSFHLFDNPLRKEHVYRIPYLAASTWKGALRSALWQLGHKEKNTSTVRLFGLALDSIESQAGRLHFYPTFFDSLGTEIINPHRREAGSGTVPIRFECVSAGTTGVLSILYVPFGGSELELRGTSYSDIADDLEILAAGVRAMVTIYGIGAKTSIGCGIIENVLNGTGTLALNTALTGLVSADVSSRTPADQDMQLPRYLESPAKLHASLRRSDGSLKSEEEYKSVVLQHGSQYGKKDKLLYDKAKRWWEREGRKAEEEQAGNAAPADEAASPRFVSLTFDTLDAFVDAAKLMATHLRKGTVR